MCLHAMNSCHVSNLTDLKAHLEEFHVESECSDRPVLQTHLVEEFIAESVYSDRGLPCHCFSTTVICCWIYENGIDRSATPDARSPPHRREPRPDGGVLLVTRALPNHIVREILKPDVVAPGGANILASRRWHTARATRDGQGSTSCPSTSLAWHPHVAALAAVACGTGIPTGRRPWSCRRSWRRRQRSTATAGTSRARGLRVRRLPLHPELHCSAGEDVRAYVRRLHTTTTLPGRRRRARGSTTRCSSWASATARRPRADAIELQGHVQEQCKKSYKGLWLFLFPFHQRCTYSRHEQTFHWTIY